MKYFLVVTFEIIMTCIFFLPRYKFLNKFKSTFLRLFGAEIGKNVIYYSGVWIIPSKDMKIGNNVDFAKGVKVIARGGLEIGDRTLIGFDTKILTGNHVIPLNKGRIFESGYKREKITIENDVWIGANCLILNGVTIGEGAIVAGGSIVTKSIPPFSIYGGIPAKKIKDRD